MSTIKYCLDCRRKDSGLLVASRGSWATYEEAYKELLQAERAGGPGGNFYYEVGFYRS